MVCQLCGMTEATIHLTEIVNGQMVEVHICEGCAKDKAVDLAPPASFNNLLSGLVDFTIRQKDEELKITCKKCGLTYDQFKKMGRLGCAFCYESFKNILAPLIKRVQGGPQHMGKRPTRLSSSIEIELEIKELSEKLKKHVETEEFEEAAHVRDKIRMLEEKSKEKKIKSDYE